ncbi:MAG: hypothetical protein ACT452_19085 [Microthrixaceae bacterium]
MLFGFGVLGLGYVHYVLPRFNRLLGFPTWHERKWVRRWNYGLLAPFVPAGTVMLAVGVVRLLI